MPHVRQQKQRHKLTNETKKKKRTNCWHHCADKIEGASEVPPWSCAVYSNTYNICLLIVPQKVPQVSLAQIVLLAEVLKPQRPSLFCLFLLRVLQRWKDCGSTQEVKYYQHRQQKESRIVFIERTETTTATPASHGSMWWWLWNRCPWGATASSANHSWQVPRIWAHHNFTV